jgi:hypothetical protein
MLQIDLSAPIASVSVGIPAVAVAATEVGIVALEFSQPHPSR